MTVYAYTCKKHHCYCCEVDTDYGANGVSGLLPTSFYSCSKNTHSSQSPDHHLFINKLIHIIDSIIILSRNRTYSMLVITVPLIDHNSYEPGLIRQSLSH